MPRTRSRTRRTEPIFPPGVDQISSVSRAKPPTFDDLILRYGADEVERAKEYADRNGARNALAYMTRTLDDWHGGGREWRDGEAPQGLPHKRRLLCDICELPSWIDDMVSRAGRAFCGICASKQAGANWDEERRLAPAQHIHTLTQGDSRCAPTEAELLAEPSTETLAEITRFAAMGPAGVPILLDWYLFPGNALYPKHQAALKAALKRSLGDEAEDALPEPPGMTEPTENARAVSAYWTAQAVLDGLEYAAS